MEKFNREDVKVLSLKKNSKKCANNGFLAKYKQNKYANRLMEMDACLQGELNVLSVQVASHVRETTSAIRTMQELIERIKESAAVKDQIEVAESSSSDEEKEGLVLLNKMEEVEAGNVGVKGSGEGTRSLLNVHHLMCTELWKLVERISKIFSDIEAARHHCSTGIQALCQLSRAIDRAKQLVQYCSESSKLYLAFTGDVIVLRFQKSRNLLEQSLCQILNWVPEILVAEISKIVLDVMAATFRLDPSEDKAGKVVRELIYLRVSASDTTEDSELKALKLVSVRLHITTAKEVLIEKRSIKKLLKKVGDSDHRKKDILTYFLYLFRKYGNLILVKKTENASVWEHASLASENSGKDWGYNQCAETKSHTGYREYEAESNMSPPEELLCGISSRLMYDPVVIASGQTYERMWIQKRFHEGNETCPKTNTELAHLSLTPNVAIRESTSKCCTKYGATIPDPMQKEALDSWENSATSISSFGSSMNDLRIQMDLSDMSFGSSDTSFNSKIEDSSNLVQIDDDSLKYRYAKQHEPEPEAPRDELPRDNGYQSNGKKTSEASGFFGKKISIFSKPSSLSSKKK